MSDEDKFEEVFAALHLCDDIFGKPAVVFSVSEHEGDKRFRVVMPRAALDKFIQWYKDDNRKTDSAFVTFKAIPKLPE